jgi:hypothetical protein
MTFAEWSSLAQTVILLLTGAVVAWYTAETREMRKTAVRQADAAVVKEAYDYIIGTHPMRRLIFRADNAELIRGVRSPEDLRLFKEEHDELDQAIHAVANCYHYIGFLMHQGLLTAEGAILEEGGHTIVRVHELIGPYIQLEREQRGDGYKQYFLELAGKARLRLGRGLANTALPAEPAIADDEGGANV